MGTMLKIKESTEQMLEEIFWLKTRKGADNECWPWVGVKDQRGYGQIHANGKRIKATCFSWELFHGAKFPSAMEACHSCDNPNCVNPKHIWPGTHRENMLDAAKKQRLFIPPRPKTRDQRPVVTHCYRGHEYSEENTYLTRRGAKVCKICRKMAYTKHDRKRRQTIKSSKGGES